MARTNHKWIEKNTLVHDFTAAHVMVQIAASKLKRIALPTLYQLHGYGMAIHGIE